MNLTFDVNSFTDNGQLAVCKLDEYLESVIDIVNKVDPKYKKLVNTILTTKVLTQFTCEDKYNNRFAVIDYDLLKTTVQESLSSEDYVDIKKNKNFCCHFMDDKVKRYTRLVR